MAKVEAEQSDYDVSPDQLMIDLIRNFADTPDFVFVAWVDRRKKIHFLTGGEASRLEYIGILEECKQALVNCQTECHSSDLCSQISEPEDETES